MPHSFFDLEWNTAKAAANVKKHDVSFEEAATVFEDDSAYVKPTNYIRMKKRAKSSSAARRAIGC